jgi:hypothetical protein
MLDARITALRLRRHHLSGASRIDFLTICRDICGAQAQLLPSACLQLWIRNPRITRAGIEAALWQSRTLVRTTLMRQTVHLIPSEEFPIYVAALQSSQVHVALRVMARFGITTEESDALNGMILELLSAGPMSRTAITEAIRPRVSKRVRAWMDKVWSILRLPVARGLVCHGPGVGGVVKFVRTDRWLPPMEMPSEAEAQCILLRRFLRAYGPATAHDFAHWSGMAVRRAASAFDLIKGELTPVEGQRMILLEDSKALNSAREPDSVKLLPAFDPFLLAHSTKDHLVEEQHYKRVYQRLAMIAPVILVNGRVVGYLGVQDHRGAPLGRNRTL